MPLKVITPAANRELTTAATLAAHMGLSAEESASNINLLHDVIRAASHFIERYTGRVFAQETVEETLIATGTPRIVLARTPIVSVTSVELNGTALDASEYEIENADAGFLYRKTGWTDTRKFGSFITIFPTRYSNYNWKVTYVAGYKMPADTDRNLPHDIEYACILLAKQYYLRRQEDPTVFHEAVGDAWITRHRDYPDLPQMVREILDRYTVIE